MISAAPRNDGGIFGDVCSLWERVERGSRLEVAGAEGSEEEGGAHGVHEAGHEEGGGVGEVGDDPAGGELGDDAAEGAAGAGEAHDAADFVVGVEVGGQRLEIGDPDAVADGEEGGGEEGEGGVGDERGEHGKGHEGGAGEEAGVAGAAEVPAFVDQVAGEPAAADVAEAAGEEGEPGVVADHGEVEAAAGAEVFGEPEDGKVNDGVGEEAGESK